MGSPDKFTILLSLILGIESLGYAMVLPLIPFMAQNYGADAVVIGAIFAIYSVCQLVSSPLIGSLSDTWGRKPLLLLSQATTCLGFIVLSLSNSLGMIFLSRVIDGASAGNVSVIYTAVIDRYQRDSRTFVLGILSAGTGLGLLAGPLLGGLLGASGFALPALVAAGLSGVTIILTLLLFPGKARPTQGETPTNFRASIQLLREPSIRGTLRVIAANTALYSAFVLGMSAYLHERLGYSATQVGPVLTGLLLLGAAFQVLVLPRLLTSLPNRTSARIGFCLYLLGFGALVFVADLAGVVAAAGLVVWGVVILNPVLSGALANQARGADDGALMGLNQAVACVGQIAGPLVGYTAIYFASGTGLALVCLGIAVAGLLLSKGMTIYG